MLTKESEMLLTDAFCEHIQCSNIRQWQKPWPAIPVGGRAYSVWGLQRFPDPLAFLRGLLRGIQSRRQGGDERRGTGRERKERRC